MLSNSHNLDGHIRDLLYDHDCVIVMGLGGFIAHYHPATINESLKFITPPSKRIAFNAALRNNDGLLAHHITYREHLTYAQACAVVTAYANTVKAELDRGGKHKIDKVGVLYNDQSGNTQFLPDTSTNFLPDSFGLSLVPAVPLVDTEEQALTGTDASDTVIVDFQSDEAKEKPIRRLRIMEMIPAAAVLALLIMAPPIIDRFNAHMGSLVPFTRIDEVVSGEQVVIPPMPNIEIIKQEPILETNTETVVDTFVEAQSADADPVVETEEVSTDKNTISSVYAPHQIVSQQNISAPNSSEQPTSIGRSFHIIVGSYKNRKNAKRMIKELDTQGIKAELIQRGDGHMLVSVYAATSQQGAENQLPVFRSQVIASAWVFERVEN